MRKKLLFNNKSYSINVETYYNGRIRLKYENNGEINDITINMKNIYIKRDYIIINPKAIDNNLFHILISNKIIDNIISSVDYNGRIVPVCSLNMGVLRKYDFAGVNKYLSRRKRYAK